MVLSFKLYHTVHVCAAVERGSLTSQVILSDDPLYHTVPDNGAVIVTVGGVMQVIAKVLLVNVGDKFPAQSLRPIVTLQLELLTLDTVQG